MSFMITNQDTINQEKEIIIKLLKFYDDATYKGWSEKIIRNVRNYISRIIHKTEKEIFQIFLSHFPKDTTTKISLTKQAKLHASFIGFCYHFEIGTTVNPKKAFEYYIIAAEHGDGFALSQIGGLSATQLEYNHTTSTKYIEYVHKSAKIGHPHGAYKMAIVTTGRLRAFWYLKAAEKNFPDGLTKAAQLYKTGEYVIKDVHRALRMALLVRRVMGEKNFSDGVWKKLFGE
ncbi:11552_t:CDS:1 [Ambispora gerdemannii]|uniref:11552_t:CDS:1 n=1 Tax=Ambispora gerdemannii TaxID=144530 RepID=A0A9N8VSU9_9GLOM|nr:11552_t:CDS:1 [Ambispora gerdemannii]